MNSQYQCYGEMNAMLSDQRYAFVTPAFYHLTNFRYRRTSDHNFKNEGVNGGFPFVLTPEGGPVRQYGVIPAPACAMGLQQIMRAASRRFIKLCRRLRSLRSGVCWGKLARVQIQGRLKTKAGFVEQGEMWPDAVQLQYSRPPVFQVRHLSFKTRRPKCVARGDMKSGNQW